MAALKDAATKRNVTILYETPAVDLILDPSTREVKGLVATSGGKNINVKAKRGVILACGGFEFDFALQASTCRRGPYTLKVLPATRATASRWRRKQARLCGT